MSDINIGPLKYLNLKHRSRDKIIEPSGKVYPPKKIVLPPLHK